MLFHKEELNNMSIHELRIRAREIGVKAPTSKKQQELADEIIKIQNGELLPYKTKMGRPVKTNVRMDILKEQMGILANNNYSPVNLECKKPILEDGQKIETLNDSITFECCGVVRKLNSNYYIQNYINGAKYITMSKLQKKEFNLEEGDFVRAKAKFVDLNFGELTEVISKNFDAPDMEIVQECKVVVKKKLADMYSYIKKDSKINKIVLEIESNTNVYNKLGENCVALTSKECDNVSISFNVLLDCKNLINNLCINDIPFILYINDVEYIYSILKVYYLYIKKEEEINAGQFFKEILSTIKNSKKGNVILFEKEEGKRSSYLDLIINKYCK